MHNRFLAAIGIAAFTLRVAPSIGSRPGLVFDGHPQQMQRTVTFVTVQHALKAVIADGTCDALIKKWGLEQAVMRSAPVDAGALFE